MFRMLIRLTLLCAATWLCTPSVVAQSSTQRPTLAELQKNLALMEASTEGESEAIDRLLEQTTQQLVAYLGTHELPPAAAEELGLDLTTGPLDAASLKVYTFSYSSGGTRGTVDRPVVQWKNATGKLFAYALGEECFFDTIYKLTVPGRTQYLLLGAEKGDSQCVTYQAFVIELKGNYLLVDTPAFGKNPSLVLCNAPLSFDTSKQTLQFDFSDYLQQRGKEGRLADKQYLAQSGYHQKPGTKRLVLQFRNGHFVQQP